MAATSSYTISKSSFIAGSQCAKLLWTKFHDRGAFPKVGEAQQAIFDQGHEIGNMAKRLYPGGIEVAEGIYGYSKSIAETDKVISERLPLYEPAFEFNSGFARVDILNPVGEDSWEIIEVKSGTRVKDQNLVDVAFQKYVCEGSGLKISGCYIMHVNNKYVREGELDPLQLLVAEEVSEDIKGLSAMIPERLEELKKVSNEDRSPEIKIGSHCNTPYECELKYRCWNFLPEYPVTDLYRDNKGRRWDFLEKNILNLKDIPESSGLNAKQEIQRKAAIQGHAEIDKAAIREFLDELKYPLTFFDIESFQKAVPPYDGLPPYRQIPFQFSVHVQDSPDSELKHYEFLAANKEDPRSAFMEKLIDVVPDNGKILVYNASFEKARIKECAKYHPQFQPWVDSVLDRFLDLLVPFSKFSYYHPDQHGSASIKQVLPALTETDYSELIINEGSAASLAFVEMVFDPETTEVRKEEIRKGLLEYCALDTKAMVDILNALIKACAD